MSLHINNRNKPKSIEFEELVQYIRSQGCKVKLYTSVDMLKGGTLGEFIFDPEPLIRIATKQDDKGYLNGILCHEFMHFLQWKHGILQRLSNNWGGWDILEKWLDGEIELGREKVHRMMVGVTSLEHHAEIMALKFARLNNIEIQDVDLYISEYNNYMSDIKYYIKHRTRKKILNPTCTSIKSKRQLLELPF